MIFLKWLKQHLKIKKFWGTTENAGISLTDKTPLRELFDKTYHSKLAIKKSAAPNRHCGFQYCGFPFSWEMVVS